MSKSELVAVSERISDGGGRLEGLSPLAGRLDLSTLLVREAVQNSWDARDDRRGEEPVHFAIDGWDLDGDRLEQLRELVPVEDLYRNAFGRNSDPGTDLPYRQVGYSDWWVSDVDSAKYNTFQSCRPGSWCGFDQGSSEQLGAISLYAYAVVIDYNRKPVVAGKGSAFFLHVTEYAPTQGCVSIEQANLVRLLTWLKPARNPIISIGVGEAAYAPINGG